MLFDNSWPGDLQQLEYIRSWARWSTLVAFDEVEACRRSLKGQFLRWCAFRALGNFSVVEVALADVPPCTLSGSVPVRFERANDRRASMTWDVGVYRCARTS